jgi:hypothetical protein
VSTFDTVPSDGAAVPLGRRAAGGFLDVGIAAAACFVLLDIALNLGAPWAVAWSVAAVGPSLLWAELERRGVGSVGRFAGAMTVRTLDGEKLGYLLALRRQGPLGLLASASVLVAPGIALILLALGLCDLAAGRGQPLHRTFRDRLFGTMVVSTHAVGPSGRIAGYAYLESGAPMRYRHEGDDPDAADR